MFRIFCESGGREHIRQCVCGTNGNYIRDMDMEMVMDKEMEMEMEMDTETETETTTETGGLGGMESE